MGAVAAAICAEFIVVSCVRLGQKKNRNPLGVAARWMFDVSGF
jgi:hypothetical protein